MPHRPPPPRLTPALVGLCLLPIGALVRPLTTPPHTMIRGVHTMFYTSQPGELRAFLRDKLGFPFTDVGDGWLIFDLPEADMGCHPADPAEGGTPGAHDISF